MTSSDLGRDETRVGAGASAETVDRDTLAGRRDEAAENRDIEANERDDISEARDQDYRDEDALRGRTGSTRQGARAAAGQDRSASAGDREMSSEDRAAAARDRTAAKSEIESLLYDQLTGIYQRSVGLTELGREVLKAVAQVSRSRWRSSTSTT